MKPEPSLQTDSPLNDQRFGNDPVIQIIIRLCRGICLTDIVHFRVNMIRGCPFIFRNTLSYERKNVSVLNSVSGARQRERLLLTRADSSKTGLFGQDLSGGNSRPETDERNRIRSVNRFGDDQHCLC